MIRHHSADLLFVFLVAVAGAALAFAPNVNNPIRIWLTLPLVILLPGYALTAAIFSNRAFGFPERLTFTFGLSLAVAVLGGLMLNLTPWGLQTSSWAILLSGITISAAFVALIRRRQYPTVHQLRLHLNVGQGLLFGLAAILVGAALAVSSMGALRQPALGFTQLWILPDNITGSNNVYLGLSNYEATTLKYKLQLRSGESIVRDWALIELEPGEKWEIKVIIPVPHSDAETLEASLYRLDDPETIYRRVVLWRGP